MSSYHISNAPQGKRTIIFYFHMKIPVLYFPHKRITKMKEGLFSYGAQICSQGKQTFFL